ncbi:MAG: hypothetical protein MZW92_14985 [Comamonadaceae bacterium]|nr:hypothetical protein [Comamonadaceae bacterium]
MAISASRQRRHRRPAPAFRPGIVRSSERLGFLARQRADIRQHKVGRAVRLESAGREFEPARAAQQERRAKFCRCISSAARCRRRRSWRAKRRRATLIRVTLGSVVNATLSRRTANGRSAIERGMIGINETPQAAPQQGVLVTGTFKSLNLDAWRRLLARRRRFGAAAAGNHGEPEGRRAFRLRPATDPISGCMRRSLMTCGAAKWRAASWPAISPGAARARAGCRRG